MNKQFYREFEDEFRGSSELIQERLEQYLPIIDYIKKNSSSPSAIDLGCGRGEWLNFCQKNSLNVQGLDLDEAMVKESIENGFNVKLIDALEYLKKLDDDSIDFISSFHMIEHLSFDVLYKIIEESYRVLKPGGAILLETPNCENVIVGTNNFYLDPTHIKPIPNLLLSFLMKFLGFKDNKILRVNGGYGEILGMTDVFEKVSKDYSILGLKTDDENLINKIYPTDYGISQINALQKLDEFYNNKFSTMSDRIDTLEKINERKLTSIILREFKKIFKRVGLIR